MLHDGHQNFQNWWQNGKMNNQLEVANSFLPRLRSTIDWHFCGKVSDKAFSASGKLALWDLLFLAQNLLDLTEWMNFCLNSESVTNICLPQWYFSYDPCSVKALPIVHFSVTSMTDKLYRATSITFRAHPKIDNNSCRTS